MCKQTITDRMLKATGNSYHPNCFTCVVCHKPLEGASFIVDKGNQPHCVDDYHRYGTLPVRRVLLLFSAVPVAFMADQGSPRSPQALVKELCPCRTFESFVPPLHVPVENTPHAVRCVLSPLCQSRGRTRRCAWSPWRRTST